MSYADKLVSAKMLQDLYGVNASSTFSNTNILLTFSDIYNYQGDWNVSFVDGPGSKIVKFQDLIDKALVDQWRYMNNFNEVNFKVNGSFCECVSIVQRNLKSPDADLQYLNIYLYHTYSYGHCLDFTIDQSLCSEGAETEAIASSNSKSAGLVGISLGLKDLYKSRDQVWKDEQLFLWGAYDFDNAYIEIYGNNTVYTFTFNSNVSIDGGLVKYYN